MRFRRFIMLNPDANSIKSENSIKSVQGELVFETAEVAPMEKDQIWSRGDYTYRVKLKGLDDKTDSRFFLSAMKTPVFNFFKKIHAWLHYVTLNVGGQKVLVNINSIAKRLLLTKKEIKDAHKEGRLEALIQQRVEALSKNKDLLSQLEYVDQTHSETGTLQLKATRTKVERTATEILASGWHYVKDDKIHKVEDAHFSAKAFAEGTFAKVIQFVGENRDQMVIKALKAADFQKAKTQATNEQRVLQHLNALRLNTYTQKPYHAVRSDNQVALIGSYIEGHDLRNWLWNTSRGHFDPKNIPNAQKTVVIKQLLKFFHEVVIQGRVCHNDLNPANIRITPQGNVAVIDFGSAIILDDRSQVSEKNFQIFSGYSERYSDPKVVHEILKLEMEGLGLCAQYNLVAQDPNKKAEAEQLQVKLKEKRKALYDQLIYHNFYGMMIVIAEIITGDKIRPNESFREYLSKNDKNISVGQMTVLIDPDDFEVHRMDNKLFAALAEQLTTFNELP